MSTFRGLSVLAASVMAVTMMTAGVAGAQAKAPATLGSVKLSRAVTADGKPLGPGTYTLRVSTEMPAAVVGLSADESRWVEFTQSGQVKGREMATVLSKDALKAMKKGGAPAGSTRVELLKGEDYIRVWVNHAGQNYLIHLASAK